ncbi:CpsD/CapB family tyrosine-protein kinase [Leifsonia xyli]|uniref:CpsD/CapB family tyrosine-protein kinase n=1 Tax=Leifsonia xyli TaxID=1575 RepID=UPI001CB87C8A|nr:CpsD/CapB family tyrosine-protein kinase [Leifsonia xyli]
MLVTSSMPSEGKSTLSANLAVTIARGGQPVVVVDADMRHPTQGKTFGIPNGAGLSDVLAGRVSLREVLQDPDVSLHTHIRVLTAGRTPPNPSELLGSRTMRELLAALSELAVVIVDAPPLLPVTDAAVLSKSVDGVLLVVNAKRTKIDQLGKALRTLDQAAGKLTGVVLNRVPRRGADAVNYGYYGAKYGYGYYHDASLTAGPEAAPAPAATPVPTPAEPDAADRDATDPHSTSGSVPEPVPAEPANRGRRAARHG